MHANGVRGLDISCWTCHHAAVLDVEGYADDVSVPWFGPRMVCTRCGIIGCRRLAKLAGRAAARDVGWLRLAAVNWSRKLPRPIG